MQDVRLRPARLCDASDLAVLMDIASRGLLVWVWSEMAQPGRSPLEFARQRICTNPDLPSFHANWKVVEIDGKIIGAMAGYRVPTPYDPGETDGLPEAYTPLLDLESLAAGTWHLMSLAVFSNYRNRGIGGWLIDQAERVASTSHCDKISLIAHSTNDGARRLYARKGYSLSDRRSSEPLRCLERGEWHLLQKKIGGRELLE